MRINKYVALATGLSRRAADLAISEGRITINEQPASLGANAQETDKVCLNGRELHLPASTQTILLNKPVGYVCSRDGQGSPTIYELLPTALHHLKPVGRLDKDSSGVLLMTNDGNFAHRLAHPGFQKEKRYRVNLNKELRPADQKAIEEGVPLVDGPSRLELKGSKAEWEVTMHEGRNRQIRRTFEAGGYDVVTLERIQFGPYSLKQVGNQRFINI
ncbi:MAG: pseudouridine synthase [Candidatus Saccharimonadales bacterium]